MNGVTWVGSPNFTSGREGRKVDHITLHIMVGTLAGTDSVFQQPGGSSASYGIGGSGAIHQYVSEGDGPWSDANWESNMTTISIEHEGGSDNIACTQACMDASATLCADISMRYGLGRLVHNGLSGNVYLHREIPGSDHATCPDLAPNGLNVQYVLDKANYILGAAGTLAPGGMEKNMLNCVIQLNDEPGLNYFDGSKLHTLVHPDDVTALQLVAQHCGVSLPIFKLGSNQAPWGTRLREALQH